MNLNIGGEFKQNIVAYARSYQDRLLITAVSRLLTTICDEDTLPLGETWKDTSLIMPEKFDKIRNEITCAEMEGKEKIKATEIFRDFPAALLNCYK